MMFIIGSVIPLPRVGRVAHAECMGRVGAVATRRLQTSVTIESSLCSHPTRPLRGHPPHKGEGKNVPAASIEFTP